MNPEDIEIIDWLDHVHHGGWQPLSQIDNTPLTIRSVGWVIVENDTALTIAGHGNLDQAEDEYQGLVTIIKATIVDRKKFTTQSTP